MKCQQTHNTLTPQKYVAVYFKGSSVSRIYENKEILVVMTKKKGKLPVL